MCVSPHVAQKLVEKYWALPVRQIEKGSFLLIIVRMSFGVLFPVYFTFFSFKVLRLKLSYKTQLSTHSKLVSTFICLPNDLVKPKKKRRAKDVVLDFVLGRFLVFRL